jgi:hypothetical protein
MQIMHKNGLLNCIILNLLFLYLKERNAENDTVSSQNFVFLARADTCIQGEGRHNILVQLEIANQLRGEGVEKGRSTIWPGNILELPAVHLGFRGQIEGILFRGFVRAACRTSVRKRGGKRPLGQCRWRWDSNVK